MSLALTQIWWTAAEIAAAGLADLPGTRKGVELLAKRLGWRADPAHARRRQGKGGGWEYHWQLFPMRAQRQLLATAALQPATPRPDRDRAWEWFEGLREKPKAAARARLAAIGRVEALVAGGQTKFAAVNIVAVLEGCAPRTIWGWFEMIEGVRSDDRLPYLAPRHHAAPRAARKAECDPAFFGFLKSDFLRPAAPSFASCYRRARRAAEREGWEVLPERTMRRMFEREVSKASMVLARKGIDALKRLYPPQVRDKTALHALEVVNGDFHKFDVFVRFPAERGEAKPWVGRPQMVAFQDVYSGRILAWRLDREPNAVAVQLAAGDMVEAWGIPEHVLLDNGREFAAKAITGGAPTRYRFKVRENDLPGLFVALGCKVLWATPYSGQSKPIERAFLDMCDTVAKDPRLDGAWTGNRPDAKPEDYGSRAIELDDFLEVLGEGIEEHNTRAGRRSEVAFGRSFAEVFDESYAAAPIRKATAEQRRLWLLGAEGVRADASSGALRFLDNEFYAEWLQAHAGERVIIRFDPADLWAGVHVYSAANAYLGHAPCRQKAGFLDMAEARAHAKARRDWMNAERRALAAHRTFQAAELGQMLDEARVAPAPAVEAKIVKPVFGKGIRRAPAPAPGTEQETAAAQAAVVADLAAKRGVEAAPEESERDRFRRALELERRIERGETVTPDQQRWLAIYRTTDEYRAEHALWRDFGDRLFV